VPQPAPTVVANRAIGRVENGALERVVGRIGLFALGTWYTLGSGIASSVTVGDVVVLLLLPVWLRTLSGYRAARLLMCTTAVALVSGLALSAWARPDHSVSSGITADAVMLLFGTVCGAGFVVWARAMLSVAQIGIWYGLGLLTQVALQHALTLTTDGWKHGFAVAAGVLALAVASTSRWRRTSEGVALVALAGVSISLDSRSYLATFLLTLMVVIWQSRPRLLSHPASWTWTAGLLGGLAVGIYYLGTTLLVNGYLGRAAQARSVEQIHAAGSLILGGRPELGATLALLKYQPWGFGAGVIANWHDIMVAKIGLAKLNYDPNNGYVDKFMFGGQIELHSTMGDIWANFGLAGLLVVVLIAFLVVRGLAQSISERTGIALLVFLCWWTLWNLAFSPFLSAAPSLVLALGLVLPPRATASPDQPSPLRRQGESP
jgi:hypothetical protein